MVLIDGSSVPAFDVSWEVDNNTNYQADTFRCDLLLTDSPETGLQAQLDYWASLAAGEVELLGGFPANPDAPLKSELTSFLTGQIDEIHVDPLQNKVELYGRDYTSYFLDSKTAEKFQNKRASDIAALLAQRHGLLTQITPTDDIVGTYYQIDHVSLNSDRTEWDLLTYLAKQEGYDCYVQGKTLVFQPKELAGEPFKIDVVMPSDSNPLITSTAMELRFTRNLTLAGDVTVVVRSWNHKQAKGFSVTSPPRKARNALNPPKGNRPPQVYTFIRPNLTKEQAQAYANQMAETISRHEVNLDLTLPGDTILSARNPIIVNGTRTAFDQAYYPDSVIRSLGWDEGFEMKVHGKNHNAETTVLP